MSDRPPRRIHIIGGPGNGKTWLAARLRHELGHDVYELDTWIDVPAVACRPAWITEGVFLWNVEPLLQAADVIIWLDLPYRVALPRILIRHLRLSMSRRNRHRGLRLLWRFALGARHYYWRQDARSPTGPTDWDALSRVQTAATLAPYHDKVVRLPSRRAVTSWLRHAPRNWAAPDVRGVQPNGVGWDPVN